MTEQTAQNPEPDSALLMAEVKHHHLPTPFVEVVCTSSGKIRRFSTGTEARFAVDLMNRKLLSEGVGAVDILLASYIEAVKEGDEEPVSFGPNSTLVDYGHGWKLRTVLESNGVSLGVDDKPKLRRGSRRTQRESSEGIDDSHSMRSQSSISLIYIAKILLAFVLIFVFGAVFTLLLESLPQFILYINSSV